MTIDSKIAKLPNIKNWVQPLTQILKHEAKIGHSLEEINTVFNCQKNMLPSTQNSLILQIESVSIGILLKNILKDLGSLLIHPKISIHNYSKIKFLYCDIAQIKQLVLYGIRYIASQNTQHRSIQLSISDTQLGYEFSKAKKENYIKKIKAVAIGITIENGMHVPESCYLGSVGNPTLHVPQNVDALLLRDIEQIVAAHYGYTNTTSSGKTQVHIIPINLKKIRTKMVEFYSSSNATVPLFETTDAIKQENELIAMLTKKTTIDPEIVKSVIMLIKQCYGQHKRKSGEPFYTHSVAVTQILLGMTKDHDAIIAALLHDMVEDKHLTLSQISVQVGTTVAYLVDKISTLDEQIKKLSQADHITKVQPSEVKDIRVIQVKLSSRLHNLRTVQYHTQSKQYKIAKETQQFYIPLAKRIGMSKVAEELTKYCEAILKSA